MKTYREIEKLAVRKNHTIQTTFRTRKLDWKSNKSSTVAEMSDRLATVDIDRKLGAVPFFGVLVVVDVSRYLMNE